MTTDYIKTIINGLKSWVRKQIVQPDWNQNDETAADYVKNRIAYIGDVVTTWEKAGALNIQSHINFDTGVLEEIRIGGTVYKNIPRTEYHTEGSTGDYYMTWAIGEYTLKWQMRDVVLSINPTATIEVPVRNQYIKTIAPKLLPPLVTSFNGSTGNVEGLAKSNPVGTGRFSMNRKSDSSEGDYSTTLGYNCTAWGAYSCAEGNETTAGGEAAHAEGQSCAAVMPAAHAEGASTIASGFYSHSEGYYTNARRQSQHVQGEYNVLDTGGTTTSRGKYAHIVGNGTSNSKRSNAHTLDWSGNAWFAGNVYTGGTGQDDTSAVKLASAKDLANYYLKTETYSQDEVNTLLGNIATMHLEVVETLPETGASNVIYLVAKETAGEQNVYTEYLWTGEKYEIIGDTEVDLTGYAKTSELADYLPLAGGTATGAITAPSFQTGTDEANYFQTKKMRGEGDADTYYHAVDWGYANHNEVDFHEYGGIWNFYKNTKGTASDGNLIGSIKPTGWNGGAVLTGTPTAPTAAAGTNTTQIATTEFVATAIENTTLPTASATTLGGVKVGDGLAINDGVLSVSIAAATGVTF